MLLHVAGGGWIPCTRPPCSLPSPHPAIITVQGSAFTLAPLAVSGYLGVQGLQRKHLPAAPPSQQQQQPTRKEWLASGPGLVVMLLPSATTPAPADGEAPPPVAHHVGLFPPSPLLAAVKGKVVTELPEHGILFTPRLPGQGRLNLDQVVLDAKAAMLILTYSTPGAAAPGGGILVYEVAALLQHHFPPALHLPGVPRGSGLYPNPEAFPHLVAVLCPAGELRLYDLHAQRANPQTAPLTFTVPAAPPALQGTAPSVNPHAITAVCWSRKGKQLVFGTALGMLHQATPAGDIKNTILPPAPAAGPTRVCHVYWCEDRMFVAGYAQPLQEGEGVPDIVFHAITQEKGAPGATRYTQLEDPAPAFGNDQRPIAYYQAGLSLPSPLPGCSFDWKHILIYGMGGGWRHANVRMP
jgi:hypothetical protein